MNSVSCVSNRSNYKIHARTTHKCERSHCEYAAAGTHKNPIEIAGDPATPSAVRCEFIRIINLTFMKRNEKERTTKNVPQDYR